MPWAYLDDGFPTHPKIIAAEAQCETAPWVFVAALCHSRRHLTAGRIDKALARRLTGVRNPEKAIKALVDKRLWDDHGDHWMIHDYEQWNESEEAQRNARSEKARKAAGARWASVRGDAQASGVRDAQALPEQMPEQCLSPPLPKSSTPLTPTADAVGGPGEKSKGSRANGTNPRALLHAESERTTHLERFDQARRWGADQALRCPDQVSFDDALRAAKIDGDLAVAATDGWQTARGSDQAPPTPRVPDHRLLIGFVQRFVDHDETAFRLTATRLWKDPETLETLAELHRAARQMIAERTP